MFGCATLAGEPNRACGVESASDLITAQQGRLFSSSDAVESLGPDATHLTVSAGDKVIEGDLKARFDWLFLVDDRVTGFALTSPSSHP